MDEHRPEELSPREQLHVTAERMRGTRDDIVAWKGDKPITAGEFYVDIGEPVSVGVDLASGPDRTFIYGGSAGGGKSEQRRAQELRDALTSKPAHPHVIVPILERPLRAIRNLLEREAPWHLPQLKRFERELGTKSKRELSDKYWQLKRLFETKDAEEPA